MFTADPPDDDARLESLLRDHRYGPPDPDEKTPWDFVFRWPDDYVRARAWPIVSRLLTDRDDLVRARAVEFVRDWRDGADVTVPRLLDVLQRQAAMFADQAPEGIALRDSVAHALSNRADKENGPSIGAGLRRLAADHAIGGGAASVLGRFDPLFVAQQARRWGESALPWVEEATRSVALFRRDEILPFLRELRGWSTAARETVLAAVEGYVKRQDDQASAVATTYGLPQPRKSAPSTAECRVAIGL
jgi:hypothetical protein